jgi:hypothetical protein
LQIKG